MKPNGKNFALRFVLFAVCAVCLLSDLSKAETVRGSFKLPIEAYWGHVLLEPGVYDFAVDTTSPARVITLTSRETGWSGMVLSQSVSDADYASSSLQLAKSENTKYVRSIYLKDAGVALEFAAPTNSAMRKLAKSSASTVASASGTH